MISAVLGLVAAHFSFAQLPPVADKMEIELGHFTVNIIGFHSSDNMESSRFFIERRPLRIGEVNIRTDTGSFAGWVKNTLSGDGRAFPRSELIKPDADSRAYIGRRLPIILQENKNTCIGLFSLGTSYCLCDHFINPNIRSQLLFSGIAGYAVGNTTLVYRYKKSPDSESAQQRCDNRPITGSPSLMRCFLSSYGGAPLSAQIGSVVALGVIAGVGIIAGIWDERRYYRWCCWLASIGALGLFFWWLSAA